MRSIFLACISMFVLVGCTPAKPPEKIVAHISATKTADGYQYRFNDEPVSSAELFKYLKAYSKVVDEPSGLSGRDKNDISLNTVRFKAGPDVGGSAFGEVCEMLVGARIWKLDYSMEVDGHAYSHSIDLPKDESFSDNDTSQKFGVRINQQNNRFGYLTYVSQAMRNYWPKEQENVAIEMAKKLRNGEISELEHVENRPLIEFVEGSQHWRAPEFNKGKLPIEFKHNKVFASQKNYNAARTELAGTMRAHVETFGKEVTGVIVNIDSKATWGAVFLIIDAGFQLELEYPVHLSIE